VIEEELIDVETPITEPEAEGSIEEPAEGSLEELAEGSLGELAEGSNSLRAL